MPNNVEIVLSARDNASAAVAGFTKNVQAATEESEKFGTGLRHAILPVQAMTDSIISKFNPALGGVVSGLSMAAREARNLPVALGVLTVGIAAASTAVGLFIERFDAAAVATARIAALARGGDLGGLRSATMEWADAIGVFNLRMQTANQQIGSAGDALRVVVSYWQATLNEQPEEFRRRIAKANEEIQKLLPFEQAKNLSAVLIEQAQAMAQLVQLGATKALQEKDADTFLAAMVNLNTQLFRQSDATGEIIKAETALAILAAQRRDATDLEIIQLRELGARRLEAALGKENAGFVAIQQAARQGRLQIAEQIGQQRAGFSGVEDLTVAPDFIGANRALDQQRREQALSVDLQRVQILAQQNNLTEQQRHDYELAVIQAEELLKIEQARGNLGLLAVANLEAQVRQQNELRLNAERTEAIPGFTRGLKDAEEEFGSTGLRMQTMAGAIARGMAGAFSDGFFSVLTGDFKRLPDIGKQFMQSMVRAITDELGKLVMVPILGAIRGAFSQGGTYSFLGLGGAAAGAGAGGGPVVVGGATEGTQFVLQSGRLVPVAEAAQAYQLGGPPAVTALASGQIATASQADALMGGTVPLAQAATASGFSLGRVAGPLASTALLGLVAANAYQNTQTTGGIALSAGIGALTGAVAGAQIGAQLGVSGGGIYGAAAGAIIAGVLAYLGKQQADKAEQQARQVAELQRAAGAGSSLVQAAGQARNLPELFDIIRSFGSGTVGGTSPVAIDTRVDTAQGRLPIGNPNPSGPVASVEDLLRAPESLRANIQAGVSPESLASANASTSAALQAIARDLAAQFEAVQQGVGATQTEQLPGGLSRRTTVPETLAERFTGGTGTIGIESPGWNLADDADKELLLRDLHRIAADRDMRVFVRDPETDQLVTTMMVAPASPAPAGAPGATPPPPAGVPPEAIPAINAASTLNFPRFTEPLPKGDPIYGDVITGYADVGQPIVQTQVVGYAPLSPEGMAAYNARRTEFYAPYIQQLAGTAKTQLAALSLPELQAAINAGLLSPEAAASLAQAGLLPQLRAILPPELQAALDAAASTGGDVGITNPGLSSGFPGIPGIFGTPDVAATLGAGVRQALANAIPFGSQLPGTVGTLGQTNTLSGVQQALVSLLGVIGAAFGLPGAGSALAAGFGMANSYATQFESARQAMVSSHDPAALETFAAILSNDPAVSGTLAFQAALASGQTSVEMSPAQAMALNLQGFPLPNGNIRVAVVASGAATGVAPEGTTNFTSGEGNTTTAPGETSVGPGGLDAGGVQSP